MKPSTAKLVRDVITRCIATVNSMHIVRYFPCRQNNGPTACSPLHLAYAKMNSRHFDVYDNDLKLLTSTWIVMRTQIGLQVELKLEIAVIIGNQPNRATIFQQCDECFNQNNVIFTLV